MKSRLKTLLIKVKSKTVRVWKIIWTNYALIISFVILTFIINELYCREIQDKEFNFILSTNRTNIITISGILSGIIIAYLTSKVLQIRSERIAYLPELKELTQKVHKFRAIANNLIYSNLWVEGMSSFINHKYKDITFFDVKQVVFVHGKVKERASEFIRDHEMGDTAYLYLELKSFFLDDIPFDITLSPEFEVPVYYSTEILNKWEENDCGNGLWIYFDYKYGSYEDDLQLENVHSYYREEILKYSLQIDKERYKNDGFDRKLLSKLGSQFSSDIIPRLCRIQASLEKGLPRIIKYLFTILCILIIFGITLPIITEIFQLSPIFDITSMGILVSTSAYIMLSFYGFLKSEIKI